MLKFSPLALVVWMAVVGAALSSCIEDDISSSPAHQPEFSVDTLEIGQVFTDESTPTYSFKVYNRYDKVMSISSIRLKEESGEGVFRINVDGQSGKTFTNIEIRPNDSIFVFVASTPPANGQSLPVDIFDVVEFTTNGIDREVVLHAQGRDVVRQRGVIITESTTWSAEKPYQIFDSLVVAQGVQLNIEPGAELFFHDGAYMAVHGTLVCDGTPEQPIEFSGDRRGNVVTDISFDLMSRQWEGIQFSSTSTANRLTHTEVRNTWWGISVDDIPMGDAPALSLLNCRLRNSAGHVLQSTHSWIELNGCELAEAGYGPLYVEGGRLDMNYSTVSNYYLFSAIGGACVQLAHVIAEEASSTDAGKQKPLLQASINNCIIYGSSADMSPGTLDGSDAYVRNCVMRSAGTDDDHFLNILWDTDPMFYTVRLDYIFDYRLKPDSPAIGKASSEASPVAAPEVDFYGTPRPRPASIGAYEPKPTE